MVKKRALGVTTQSQNLEFEGKTEQLTEIITKPSILNNP
jgi:hypothetical protein